MATNPVHPTVGPEDYISPYSAQGIDYSKGPKVIFGDVDVLTIVLNDPQTDQDDEWGRTEQIALMMITEEAIAVHKELFGYNGILGLSAKFQSVLNFFVHFESNNFLQPELTDFTIGDTHLTNGQLQLDSAGAVLFNSTRVSLGNDFYIATGPSIDSNFLPESIVMQTTNGSSILIGNGSYYGGGAPIELRVSPSLSYVFSATGLFVPGTLSASEASFNVTYGGVMHGTSLEVVDFVNAATVNVINSINLTGVDPFVTVLINFLSDPYSGTLSYFYNGTKGNYRLITQTGSGLAATGGVFDYGDPTDLGSVVSILFSAPNMTEGNGFVISNGLGQVTNILFQNFSITDPDDHYGVVVSNSLGEGAFLVKGMNFYVSPADGSGAYARIQADGISIRDGAAVDYIFHANAYGIVTGPGDPVLSVNLIAGTTVVTTSEGNGVNIGARYNDNDYLKNILMQEINVDGYQNDEVTPGNKFGLVLSDTGVSLAPTIFINNFTDGYYGLVVSPGDGTSRNFKITNNSASIETPAGGNRLFKVSEAGISTGHDTIKWVTGVTSLTDWPTTAGTKSVDLSAVVPDYVSEIIPERCWDVTVQVVDKAPSGQRIYAAGHDTFSYTYDYVDLTLAVNFTIPAAATISTANVDIRFIIRYAVDPIVP